MGRMEARGKTDRKTGQVLRPGRVTPEKMQEWLKKANVELRGAGLGRGKCSIGTLELAGEVGFF